MDFDTRDYRNALGRFATGVTLVTTQTADGPLGMTVNSFASVSLDPPLVLWSPARKSPRFPAFAAATHFAVHVLTQAQRPIAERFSRDGFDFSGLEHGTGLGGVPVLQNTSACFQCLRTAEHDGGDHLILVGAVLEYSHSDAPPLIYCHGQYRDLS